MQQRKILFFTPNILPLLEGKPTGFGGGEMDVLRLATAFSELNEFAVEIMGVGANQRIYSSGRIRIRQVEGYLANRLHRGEFARYFMRLFWAVFKNDSQLVFVKLATLEMIVVFFAAKLSHKKFIFKLASDWETNRNDLSYKIFPGHPSLAKLFIFCLKRANLVIAQTKTQSMLLKQNFSLSSLAVPNGIRLEVGGTPQGRNILWIGRVAADKRIDLLFQLAADLPQNNFVAIVPGNLQDEEYQKCRADAAKLHNLQWVPGVGAADMAGYYREAKVLLMTSQAEGFPNVIIEALANRNLVVSYKVDPDNILHDNAIGLCADGDYGRLKEMLRSGFSDSNLYRDYVDRGYDYVKKNLNIDIIVGSYRNILEKI